MRNVRTSAEIDEGTATVNGTLGAIGNSLVDKVLLVLAVLEHLEELLLGHLETLKRLLLLDNLVRELLETFLVIISDRLPKCSLATKHHRLTSYGTYSPMLAIS